ncbi:MAG: helix-turn-helix transcriptional regulator [Anaerolineae bacterium]|nr:helix-turn-helix transcriptional regulator [Anaerolineae bacterium]
MFETYRPHAPLSRYVRCLWLVDDHVTYTREKILPSGFIELMINFGSPHRVIDKGDETSFNLMRQSWVAGFQTGYIINEPVAETLMLGVRFEPGGAHPFFDFPISELSNGVIDMDLIWGRFIDEARERLAEAISVEDKFRLMEALLLQRLSDRHGLDAVQHAVRAITQSEGHLPIRALSDAMGISHKHLNHQFKRMIGVTPKELARVMRLQAVLHTIDPRRPIDWADIAYRCHYYDQAHFNHDFQAFTGLSPTAYVELRAHVFGELEPGQDVHFVPVG